MPLNPDLVLQQAKQEITRLMAGGQLDRARDANIALCEKHPGDPSLWLNLGSIHGMQGVLAEAEKCFYQATRVQPDSVHAYFNLGIAQVGQEKYTEAINSYRMTLALDPAHGEASCNLGIVFLQLGDARAAFAYQYRAAELMPGVARAHYNLGTTYETLQEHEKAIECLHKAIELEPGSVSAIVHIGFLTERNNKLDEAEKWARQALQLEPGNARAHLLLAIVLRRKGELEAAMNAVETALAGDLGAKDRSIALQVRGMLWDKQGSFDRAYDDFSESNRVSETQTEYSQGHFLADVQSIRRWVDSHEKITSALEAQEQPLCSGHVFLFGFPRSGTTLLEQVLSAHSMVESSDEAPILHDVISQVLLQRSRGEIYPDCLSTASPELLEISRKWYWIRARERTGKALTGKVLVDKCPLNLVHLGMVQKLFPESRILVALRDPRDVVLSCFMRQFGLNEAMSYFTNIGSTVDLYTEVMQLWLEYRKKISLPFKEVKYEELITNFDALAPEIISFMGLTWEDAIADFGKKASSRIISTPSYEDVGKPLYTSAAGRWRSYIERMGPEVDRLSPLVEEFGYPVD